MDRFFVDKKNINLENNTCIIEGEDVKHISKVLRCKIGDPPTNPPGVPKPPGYTFCIAFAAWGNAPHTL